MKYIIMCGGKYPANITPKPLYKVKDEALVERTIRLLKEQGITDITISSQDLAFEEFGVPVLRHNNEFEAGVDAKHCVGYWVNAFYPISESVCYLFGDVFYSPQAIKTIVETEVDKVMFFASAPPFDPLYIKTWAEPFAFKVMDTKYFFDCIDLVKLWQDKHIFRRIPIAWELWQVLKGTAVNVIDYTNYVVINDYTCDVDCETDLMKIWQMVDMGGVQI